MRIGPCAELVVPQRADVLMVRIDVLGRDHGHAAAAVREHGEHVRDVHEREDRTSWLHRVDRAPNGVHAREVPPQRAEQAQEGTGAAVRAHVHRPHERIERVERDLALVRERGDRHLVAALCPTRPRGARARARRLRR